MLLTVSPSHRRVDSCGPGQLSVVVTVVSFLADPASCLSRRMLHLCLSPFTVVSFLADPAVSSEGQLGLSIRGVALLALCARLFVVWGLLGLSLLVYWWCGAAGSLYWSTGGVGLLGLSLLVYWWCGAAGYLSTGLLVVWGCWFSLYWSTGGVGLLGLSLLVYWWCGAAGSLSTGLLVVWGCWVSLYWSTGGVGLLVLSTDLLVLWGCWVSLLVYWWCGAVGSHYWIIGGVGVTVNWWSRSADLIDSL